MFTTKKSKKKPVLKKIPPVTGGIKGYLSKKKLA